MKPFTRIPLHRNARAFHPPSPAHATMISLHSTKKPSGYSTQRLLQLLEHVASTPVGYTQDILTL